MTTCPRSVPEANEKGNLSRLYGNDSICPNERVLGIINISQLNPQLDKDDLGNQEKGELYSYYRKVSEELSRYIKERGGFERVFGMGNGDDLRCGRDEGSLENCLKDSFKSIKDASSEFITEFFTQNPHVLSSDFDTERYSVSERFRRSIANVHFVSYMYLYCYFIIYKNKFGKFPDFNAEDIDTLVQQTKNFGFLMASQLEMGVQMSFLRTIFGENPQEGLGKKIRQDDMIFPSSEFAEGAFSLSHDGKYLEISEQAGKDTGIRLDVAKDKGHISLIGERKGCPAFPGNVLDITRYLDPYLRIICENFVE